MANGKKKRLIIAFRDGEAWAEQKVRKDYFPEYILMLAWNYGVTTIDIPNILEEGLVEVRKDLRKRSNEEVVEWILKTLLKKEYEINGNQYAWICYFPDFRIRFEEETKELLGPSYEIINEDAVSFFKYRLKIWGPKANRMKERLMKGQGINIEYFKKHLYKEFYKNLEWIVDHPEKSKIERMRDPFSAVWEEIRREFSNQYGEKFEGYVIHEAINVLKKKFEDPYFRLFCKTSQLLKVLCSRITCRKKGDQEIKEITPDDEREIEKKLQLQGKEDYEIYRFYLRLLSFHIELQRRQGKDRRRKKLDILIDKICYNFSWEDLVKKYNLTSVGAAKVSKSTFLKKLRMEMRAEIEPLREHLIGDVEYNWFDFKELRCLGVAVTKYSKRDLIEFVNALNKLVYGRIVLIGRMQNKRKIGLSALLDERCKISFLTESKNGSLDELLKEVLTYIKDNPLSIVIYDNAIDSDDFEDGASKATKSMKWFASTFMKEDERI